MKEIIKQEYDKNGNLIYREWNDGSWEKWEYDSNNNNTHYENSNGKKIAISKTK